VRSIGLLPDHVSCGRIDRELEVGVAAGERTEDDAPLEARERRPEAVVRPEPQREMRRGRGALAGDVERVGALEHLGIAVRGRGRADDGLPRLHDHVALADRRHGHSVDELHRRDEAQQLLDRGRRQVRLRAQAIPLIACDEHVAQTGSQQRRRGLAAGEEQDVDHRGQLVGSQVVVVGGVHERGHQRVRAPVAPVVGQDDLLDVDVEPRSRLVGVAQDRLVPCSEVQRDRARPVEDRGAILLAGPDDLRHHEEWQLAREPAEVPGLVLRDLVEERVERLDDVVLELGDLPRREVPVRDPAQPCVVVAIGPGDALAFLVGQLAPHALTFF
jgi:hypothetical protein